VEPATVTPTGVIRAVRSTGWKLAIVVSLAAVAGMIGGLAICTLTASSSPAPQLPERDVITLPPTPTPLPGNLTKGHRRSSRDGYLLQLAIGNKGNEFAI